MYWPQVPLVLSMHDDEFVHNIMTQSRPVRVPSVRFQPIPPSPFSTNSSHSLAVVTLVSSFIPAGALFELFEAFHVGKDLCLLEN